METSMVVTTVTDARRRGGVPISLKSLSVCVLNPDQLRAVTTALAAASSISNISNPHRKETS
jgi:hypothetical protein